MSQKTVSINGKQYSRQEIERMIKESPDRGWGGEPIITIDGIDMICWTSPDGYRCVSSSNWINRNHAPYKAVYLD